MVLKLAMKFQIVLLSVLFSITTSYSQDTENTISNNIVIRGAVNYDIIMSAITKEEFYDVKSREKTRLFNDFVIPSQVHISKDCYKVTTKTIKERPSLVLYEGEVEQQHNYSSGLGYRFENGEYQYIIEHHIETTGSKHKMLRLLKYNEELLYTSLNDLKIKI